MGKNENAQGKRGSLAETCCYGEAFLTFKVTKKYVIGAMSWQ